MFVKSISPRQPRQKYPTSHTVMLRRLCFLRPQRSPMGAQVLQPPHLLQEDLERAMSSGMDRQQEQVAWQL